MLITMGPKGFVWRINHQTVVMICDFDFCDARRPLFVSAKIQTVQLCHPQPQHLVYYSSKYCPVLTCTISLYSSTLMPPSGWVL